MLRELFDDVFEFCFGVVYIAGGTVLTLGLLLGGATGVAWLAAALGLLDVSCKDHLPAPGSACNGGAVLVVVDRVAVCKCEGGSK